MRFNKDEISFLRTSGFKKETDECYVRVDWFNGSDSVVKVARKEFEIYHDIDSIVDISDEDYDLQKANNNNSWLGLEWGEVKEMIGDND